jgi:mono/diheme cytochrome c family protein
MDTQDRGKNYRASTFFADGRMMRTPPAGTVSRGFEKASDHFWRGQTERGQWVEKLPACQGDDGTDCVEVNVGLLARGQGRYDIYCTPCHDQAGYGKGPVAMREAGLPPVPSYHDATRPKLALGQIFHIITYGERTPPTADAPAETMTMPGYAAQIPAADRWAIVAYVRALQRSQNARPKDFPAEHKGKL